MRILPSYTRNLNNIGRMTWIHTSWLRRFQKIGFNWPWADQCRPIKRATPPMSNGAWRLNGGRSNQNLQSNPHNKKKISWTDIKHNYSALSAIKKNNVTIINKHFTARTMAVTGNNQLKLVELLITQWMVFLCKKWIWFQFLERQILISYRNRFKEPPCVNTVAQYIKWIRYCCT